MKLISLFLYTFRSLIVYNNFEHFPYFIPSVYAKYETFIKNFIALQRCKLQIHFGRVRRLQCVRLRDASSAHPRRREIGNCGLGTELGLIARRAFMRFRRLGRSNNAIIGRVDRGGAAEFAEKRGHPEFAEPQRLAAIRRKSRPDYFKTRGCATQS